MVQRVHREFRIDNLLVRIQFTIEMVRWTGLAPREFELLFSGSRISTFLVHLKGLILSSLFQNHIQWYLTDKKLPPP